MSLSASDVRDNQSAHIEGLIKRIVEGCASIRTASDRIERVANQLLGNDATPISGNAAVPPSAPPQNNLVGWLAEAENSIAALHRSIDRLY